MPQLKNYTGSVYGGLGHLLKAYCEANELTYSEQLEQIQNLERFDYVVWRDLLEVIINWTQSRLGLEIATICTTQTFRHYCLPCSLAIT